INGFLFLETLFSFNFPSLDRELKATDASASAIAQENKIDTLVFSLKEKDAVKRAVCGLAEGTLITAEHVNSELY
ncbi:MAG: hypothetical protein IKG80_06575, partial [Clostridia bacterium]|nr:hypothetical protein [Clostridia bacterium]